MAADYHHPAVSALLGGKESLNWAFWSLLER